ncbi:hypothetical protein DICPUDRAFT_75499 [Dictyostelium purpureum]|uniref:Uncharacterized protein n=1 Tax=Dictyostelium purpureum TaxID=5786 RepID=F0ZAU3_DICPU|nr:uncharacterized protein DICPUDRAFT_75499 [Dictyostelium purpureum]EGC38979.1 hypothetical protein DICPUDRAFT_75499 [Dictyostelium purpureum]|eukprot:XP_003284544.1 hypothetical protein DICPUDRAFT_75499 [Dictyostelium purpureum]
MKKNKEKSLTDGEETGKEIALLKLKLKELRRELETESNNIKIKYQEIEEIVDKKIEEAKKEYIFDLKNMEISFEKQLREMKGSITQKIADPTKGFKFQKLCTQDGAADLIDYYVKFLLFSHIRSDSNENNQFYDSSWSDFNFFYRSDPYTEQVSKNQFKLDLESLVNLKRERNSNNHTISVFDDINAENLKERIKFVRENKTNLDPKYIEPVTTLCDVCDKTPFPRKNKK